MKSKVLSFLMVTLLSMMVLPAAGSSYYSKVTVNASGAGKVYVAKSATNSPAYNATATATNSSSNQTSAPTHTYYLYAQAEEGHEFKGWYTDEACSMKAEDVVENNGTYTTSFEAGSTTQGSPTTKIYYALFAEIGAPTITCEKSRMYINVGDEPIANDGVTAENCTPSYTSSNEAVATVDADGKVSAVGAGSAYITASAPGAIDAKYIVTVLDYTEAGKTQIGNGNFEDWTNVTDQNHAPKNWNSFETAEGSLAGTAKAQQVSMVEDHRPGSNGLFCAEIHSRSVVVANAQGNLTLGCINAGNMSPTNKDNHNFTKTEDESKSETISKIPTAMKVWVKFVPNNDSYEARVAATIHDKFNYITYGQASVDTDSNKEHVVASAEQNFTACGWTELTLPFTLSGNAVLNDQLYIVVNFTTNATPGQGSSKDYLYIDDVELVYDTEYDEVPVKVSDAQYSTFVAPFDVKMPAAITASTVETVGNTHETMLDLETVADATVAANTPVILNASAAQNRIAYGVAAPATAEFGLLTGVYENTDINEGYVLQNQAENGIGFYLVEGSKTVPAYHAYLTASANARFLGFDEETAIKAVEAMTNGKAQIFDLNGRKLNSLQKGINIVNGVKILVK